MPVRWLTRDRIIVLLALLGVTAIAWLYLIDTRQPMVHMDMAAMDMPATAWSNTDVALTFVMWWVMMVGMMLPSAAPTILLFATMARRQRARGQKCAPVSIFTIGYLVAWGGFCVGATMLQWGLVQATLLSRMLQTNNTFLGGALFILCGAYQLTPLKNACLQQCRSPFAFLLNHWRDGWQGALRMGLQHGLYCLGCCWVLMLLLFAVGVMNLVWVAALAGFVFAEKLLPGGASLGRLAGALMLIFGGYLLRQE